MKQVICLLACVVILLAACPILAQDTTPATTNVIIPALVAEDFSANSGANDTCEVAEGDYIWAVARSGGNVWDIWFYTSGAECEGIVSFDYGDLNDSVEWLSEQTRQELEQITVDEAQSGEEVEPYFMPVPDLQAICDEARDSNAWGAAPKGGLPYHLAVKEHNGLAYNATDFPVSVLATSDEDIDAVLCTSSEVLATYGECAYEGGIVLERRQIVRHVRLVNYETGEIFSAEDFPGELPPPCPSSIPSTRTMPFTGDEADYTTWLDWITVQAQGTTNASAAALRTVVNANPLNTRAEPNTQAEILGQIAYGSPVTPVVRNEAGDWVVALLPDGGQAWLYVPLLTVAGQTDIMTLPVADGPAAAVDFPLP